MIRSPQSRESPETAKYQVVFAAWGAACDQVIADRVITKINNRAAYVAFVLVFMFVL
jgi:hypothetical protein